MAPWKAPLTKAGKPCKRCRPGSWCPSHRRHKEKAKSRGTHVKPSKTRRPGSYKLTRATITNVKAALKAGARTEAALVSAAAVRHGTWVAWRDQGIQDQAEDRTSLFRELWEIVDYTRRGIAILADAAALDAALGHKKLVRDKEGKEDVYETSPDGRLAMEYVRAVDPDRYHDPRQRVDLGNADGQPLKVRLVDVVPVKADPDA